MRNIIKISLLVVVMTFAGGLRAETVTELGPASARFESNRLTVTTGSIRREWQWTGQGLLTTSLRDMRSGKEWTKASGRFTCDWSFPGNAETTGGIDGTLMRVETRVSDDDGFTGKFVEAISTIRYETLHVEVQYVVWAFPGAPGLRTQLRVKALAGFDPKGLRQGDTAYTDSGGTFIKPGARSEFLPLDFAVPNERFYWGYYNDPGNRHDQSQDMLKEQTVKGWPIFLREDIDWASGVAVKYGGAGVILVKESPKCVNQRAHDTGGFYGRPWGLASTGWGLTPIEIMPDRFRECWAHWTIVYQGGDDGLQLALKQFDTARYPVFPARDMFILGNTWGPANPLGAQFTEEPYVLKEISALADLGVDVMQIDDGWQKAGSCPTAKDFSPKYTNGWKDIKAECDRHGLRMGLWVAIQNARLEELKTNLDELGFISWKADFDHLSNRTDYEQRTAAYRAVLKHAWMKTQFALCPEYDDPRYGWYFAREYGSIFFQNIQEGLPPHLTMVPFQVLRQHWLMAKYFPANKLQVMLQNPQRTRPDLSDARQHGHGYCFAMGLPFVPCFFQSAQNLDAAGRTELRDLIKLYKTCRADLFTSLTFPIGDEPDNASWSGFQMVSQQRNGGHLLLFRELHNAQPSHELQLKFLAGKTITLENLANGEKRQVRVPNDGNVQFEIQQPADYRLYRYTVD